MTKKDCNAESASENPEHEEGELQQLQHRLSLLSLLSLQVCLVATWEALATVSATALTNGGSACLLYNYIIAFIGTMTVALSLGEMASICPSTGGQYIWVFHFSPTSIRLPAAWLTGWVNIGGQLLFSASAAFAAGLQIQGLITLNYPESYTPERWQGMLLYWLVLVYCSATNIWGAKVLPHLNLTAGVLHTIGLLAVIIVLCIMAPKQPARQVFTEFSNTSGWENDGVSWLVGLASTVYPFLGYDAACHLSDEVSQPSHTVPAAMIYGVLFNGITGLGHVLAFLFASQDLASLLHTPTGFPFIQLYYDVTGSHAAATVLSLCVTLVAIAASAAGTVATSRTAWAFSLDNAVPFSRFFSHLDPQRKVPVRVIVAMTVLQMLLGLIYVGSPFAFNAVISMAVIGLYGSYLMPIICMLYQRCREPEHSRTVIPGCQSKRHSWFRMGMNTAATAWLLVAIVMSTFPTVQPTTTKTMNWSVVVVAAWMALGSVYYVVNGRHRFTGPVQHLDGEPTSPSDGFVRY